MGEFTVCKLYLSKAVKKPTLHKIKMNDKIYINNLKFQFFFLGMISNNK